MAAYCPAQSLLTEHCNLPWQIQASCWGLLESSMQRHELIATQQHVAQQRRLMYTNVYFRSL